MEQLHPVYTRHAVEIVAALGILEPYAQKCRIRETDPADGDLRWFDSFVRRLESLLTVMRETGHNGICYLRQRDIDLIKQLGAWLSLQAAQEVINGIQRSADRYR